MFGKQFNGKLRGFGESLAKGRKGATERKVLRVQLQYAFDEKLAAAIGGDAPALQAMMAAGGDGTHLTSAGLELDTKEVGLSVKGRDDTLKIDNTSSLTATAKLPSAEGVEPTLEVSAGFEVEEEEAEGILAFLHNNLGPSVKVRMDRRQTELDLSGHAAAGE
jgi:hypothetical protein